MGVAPENLSNWRDPQQIALHFSTVWTMGVVISVNPRAPPRHGTDLPGIPGTSSEREWLVSLSLHAGYCHPSKRRLSVKPGPGMEQNRQIGPLSLGC